MNKALAKPRRRLTGPAMTTLPASRRAAAAVNGPLDANLLRKMDAWWRAANYLSVGQTYLYANPLLKQPLKKEHVKPRLVGHWGTTPGLNFIYVHLNRVINVVNLMKLQPSSEHPHGLSDHDFDTLFTKDKPIVFAVHGYPWLIHPIVRTSRAFEDAMKVWERELRQNNSRLSLAW